MVGKLEVALVAADRIVWSGEAEMVIARTTEGDVGILHGHAPLLSVLTDAVVEISTDDGVVVAAVDGGFLSVAANRVSLPSWIIQWSIPADERNRWVLLTAPASRPGRVPQPASAA